MFWILTLFALNPLTSAVVKSYEDIKVNTMLYKNHLASITSNGIWIKEKIDGSTQIIQAEGLNKNKLMVFQFIDLTKNKVLV